LILAGSRSLSSLVATSRSNRMCKSYVGGSLPRSMARSIPRIIGWTRSAMRSSAPCAVSSAALLPPTSTEWSTSSGWPFSQSVTSSRRVILGLALGKIELAANLPQQVPRVSTCSVC